MILQAVAVAVAASYVAVIRLFPGPTKGLSRDDPAVIKHRMRRVVALCIFLAFFVPLFLHLNGNYSSIAAGARLMGLQFRHDHIYQVGKAAATAYALYAGQHIDSGTLEDAFFTLEGVRNHIFAPVTEEFVFRAAVIGILRPVVSRQTLYYTPLLFGVAHVHHGFSLYAEGHSMIAVLVSVLVQLTYTSLFGLAATRVLLRSGTVLAPIAMHTVCNLFGMPQGSWPVVTGKLGLFLLALIYLY